MGSSNEDIIKAIQHYQGRLERYNLNNKSEDKMLYVLQKLSKLPIKTSHLETTGVGRTVNALKKLNGKVGDSAKDLVVSWKEMVLEEEKAAQDTSMETEEDADSTYSSDNEIQALHIEDGKENVNNQSDNESDSEEYSHKKEDSTKSKHQNYLENKTSKYKELDKHSDKHYNVTNSSNSDEEESNKPSRKREHSTDSSSDERSRHNLKKNKRESENSSSNHKGKEKSTRVEKEKRHENKDRHKNNDDMSKSKRDPEQSNHKSEKRSKHEDKTEKASHSSKHKSSSDSHSSKKESRNKKEKDKHKSRRESSSIEKKVKESSNDEKTKSKNSHSSSRSHSKDKRNSENGEKKSPKEKVKKASKEKIINGIDSESGASFAEALGMCGPVSSQSTKKKPSSEKKPSSSSSKSKHEESSSSSSSKPIPDLLVEEPREPLNICLSNLLPEITPNYKPTPIILDSQLKKVYNDDEALSRVMSNKNQRTKVYSGNKTVGKVESLFQICVRILQEHIDALEYTGGVPYLILKPILDRATPDQLFNMEHHNPYLIEETDELWQLHCQKDFRTKKREELESWREMYMRCLDEREARLNFITANIKQSQDKSEPLRTTKMAYIDSGFVKPPRNIARKQAKNGTVTTDRKMTPTQKLSALAKSSDATEKIAVPSTPSRAPERSSSSAAMKPKKAPLMAKTLSFLKNRFKR